VKRRMTTMQGLLWEIAGFPAPVRVEHRCQATGSREEGKRPPGNFIFYCPVDGNRRTFLR
jgi:hypothetical protein